jgi:hypothetical protein
VSGMTISMDSFVTLSLIPFTKSGTDLLSPWAGKKGAQHIVITLYLYTCFPKCGSFAEIACICPDFSRILNLKI